MSSIDAGSNGVSESLTLSNSDGRNSDIKSMSLKTDSVVPALRDSISLLVGSRDNIYDLLVTINKGI